MYRTFLTYFSLTSGVFFAAFSPVLATAASPTIVYGPGTRPLIYETRDVDYHVLDGTQIISPSRTGPPEDFVVVTDAIEFRGGGHIRIDGGYFRGGDASYTGINGNSATVSAGEALHLRQSSGEVRGGTFIGGEASSSTWLGSTSGGDGLILVESSIVIHGGYFEGGMSSEPELLGSEFRIRQAPGIIATPSSQVVMYGGEVNGNIVISGGASLSIFGLSFEYEGDRLSGVYRDGTPFNHAVSVSPGATVLLNVIPEPHTALLVVTGGLMAILLRPWSRQRPVT